MYTNREIGQRLKRIREDDDLTQEYFAEILAIPVQEYANYDKKELTETNVHEWETEYNNGVKPEPSLGTREILKYYIEVERKEVITKLNSL